jgi:hypothetical protein
MGFPEFGFAGTLVAEWWGQFGMSAIRSGWFCSAEFCWIAGALIELEFARPGSVQPTRQAQTAIHRESPVAVAALKL